MCGPDVVEDQPVDQPRVPRHQLDGRAAAHRRAQHRDRAAAQMHDHLPQLFGVGGQRVVAPRAASQPERPRPSQSMQTTRKRVAQVGGQVVEARGHVGHAAAAHQHRRVGRAPLGVGHADGVGLASGAAACPAAAASDARSRSGAARTGHGSGRPRGWPAPCSRARSSATRRGPRTGGSQATSTSSPGTVSPAKSSRGTIAGSDFMRGSSRVDGPVLPAVRPAGPCQCSRLVIATPFLRFARRRSRRARRPRAYSLRLHRPAGGMT